jgi:hypothetical protein
MARSGSVEGGTVGVRAGADDAFEVIPESRGRAESDLAGDSVDRVAGGFQQVLRLPDAGAVQPVQWCGVGFARGSGG